MGARDRQSLAPRLVRNCRQTWNMNGTLGEQIRRRLMPALEKYQGFTGTYARGQTLCELTAIPSKPEWLSDSEQGEALLQWKGLVFAVSTEPGSAPAWGSPSLATASRWS